MSDSLLIERDGGVVTLTFNRPDSLNSLDADLRVALRDTLADLDADPDCRAVVLTGAGRAFCVGQDLREHVALLETGTDDPLHAVREHYNPIATRLATLGRPVVAAVRSASRGKAASGSPPKAGTGVRAPPASVAAGARRPVRVAANPIRSPGSGCSPSWSTTTNGSCRPRASWPPGSRPGRRSPTRRSSSSSRSGAPVPSPTRWPPSRPPSSGAAPRPTTSRRPRRSWPSSGRPSRVDS